MGRCAMCPRAGAGTPPRVSRVLTKDFEGPLKKVQADVECSKWLIFRNSTFAPHGRGALPNHFVSKLLVRYQRLREVEKRPDFGWNVVTLWKRCGHRMLGA